MAGTAKTSNTCQRGSLINVITSLMLFSEKCLKFSNFISSKSKKYCEGK
jgi:hypothetical protein